MERWGSGRRNQGKETTSRFCILDVRHLQRHGILERRYLFNWQWTRGDDIAGDINIRPEFERLNLSYKFLPSLESFQYPVFLQRTQCNYGGTRVWFECPGCGRRVAILYGGRIFACRSCYQIAYDSQREQHRDRLYRRAQKLHVRLGGDGNLTHDLPRKPTGMHWDTFERMSRRLFRLEEEIAATFSGKMCSLAGVRFPAGLGD